jgi:fumarate hydratase class II
MAETRAETRTETDAFGDFQVPADKYWGAQMERSLFTWDNSLSAKFN